MTVGKVALITGGAAGIGNTCSKRLVLAFFSEERSAEFFVRLARLN